VTLRKVKNVVGGDSAAVVFATVIVFITFSLINSRFLTRLDIDGIVVAASISAITGFGMTLIIAMRALDLSVGSIQGFAAIIAADLLSHGMPLFPVLVIGLATGCALGLLNGLLITGLGLPSFVATLATLSMILGGELLITQGQTFALHSSTLNKLVVGNIFGVVPAAAVEALLIGGVIWFVFYRTPFGRHIAAIGGDEQAAVGAGINVRRVTIVAFVLIGLCAAVSGLMTGAELQNVDSTIGTDAELTAIAVVVVGGTSLTGGRGSLFGTGCAAILLAGIEAGLNVANVSSLYNDLVFGAILIAALMIDGIRRQGARDGMVAM
jgi:ribose/xylose/arabinose/galactoside ABC-type transport system permease subunit